MRNLIVSEFVTLDGVMEAPGSEPGASAHRLGQGQMDMKIDEGRETGIHLLGHAAHESFAGA